MGRISKRDFFICILIILLIDTVIGCFLFKSRLFSHLAIWNIIGFNKQDYFYWKPENAPAYFHFEQNSDRLSIFKNEIFPLVKNESDEFKIMLKVAKYLMDISSHDIRSRLSLKWDSPERMLRQIKEGANANCFHLSILFSTYASSLGMKARLWALENEEFNGIAHSITEVYIEGLRKWVFIDVTSGFYVTENKRPLSFLELREKLLRGYINNISIHNIRNERGIEKEFLTFYSRLTKCVFLRADNDFINKYNARIRYGFVSLSQRYIDKFPDNIRIGLDYLLGRRDIFIHYVDIFSRSLKAKIIIAKLLFYFFIFSLSSIGILLVILFFMYLKCCLARNLSKKDTRHR